MDRQKVPKDKTPTPPPDEAPPQDRGNGALPPDSAAKPDSATRPPWLDGYCFTLAADIQQTFVGEAPGGFRVDLQYASDGAVSFDFPSRLDANALSEFQEAKLLTGTDWVSVSNDAIATFDTRITFRVGPVQKNPEKRCVISANVRGRAFLGDCRKEDGTPEFDRDERPAIMARWQQGFSRNSYLPLALSAVFDVPTRGYDPAQDEVYEKCRALERGLFVAFGRANYLGGTYSRLGSIRLDFTKVPLPPLAADSTENRESVRKTLLAKPLFPPPSIETIKLAGDVS